MHYFDYAASTPLDRTAAEVYCSAAENVYGNTTSLHDTGGAAANLLEHCRSRLAAIIGVRKEGLFFTSGGTESNALALVSLAQAAKRPHIIIGAAEHPSVHSAADYLAAQGFSVTKIPYTKNGFIDLALLEQAITDDTALISVQHCNPEIGTVQPLKEIRQLIGGRTIYFHSDCVQSFGKIDISAIIPYVDSISLSSHKLYGPKGVGALYINPQLQTVPLFPGGVHEKGLRAGTVNVPGIAAFTAAAEQITDDSAHYAALRRQLVSSLQTSAAFTLFGSSENQLPHIAGLCVKSFEGQLVMLELNRRGFAVSTGSACQVGQQQATMTMAAMDVDETAARGFIRISFGRSSNSENVQLLSDALHEIAAQSRQYHVQDSR